ncbi:MAG: hypothetical protein LBH58_01105 [Tannerellaceae bacterium]|jgi:hypothetical protein|nr:hypothetical protein [Tannerellaceae bacterium]
MKTERSIEFINEIDGLENVSLEEVKGGLALSSYAGGCSPNDHQVVERANAVTLC